MRKLIITTILFFATATSLFADGGFFRSRKSNCSSGYCYPQSYYKPEYRKDITVINNLIGIPVPVPYQQPLAQQGSTVYGYLDSGYSSEKLDLGVLYNQANRLADQAQQLAGQATLDFHGIVKTEGDNRARVAEIIAKGQAVREALNAANPSTLETQSSTTQAFRFSVTKSKNGTWEIQQDEQQPAEHITTRQTLEFIKNTCVECHNAQKMGGNIDMTKYVAFNKEKKDRVRLAITNPDPKKRMPKGKPHLTPDEMRLFFVE